MLEFRDDGSVGPEAGPEKNRGDGSSERLVEEEVTKPNCWFKVASIGPGLLSGADALT
jgi:hypothetical protein